MVILSMISFYKKKDSLVYIQSKIDKKYYFVQKRHDSQQAADKISMIKIKVDKLIEHLKNINNGKSIHPKSDNLETLFRRYNPDNIMEAPLNSKNTSYSLNKGEQIVICIRSKEPEDYGKIHDDEIIFYVVLHELAHVMSHSVGHNLEFYENFKFLLKEAEACKIYTIPRFDLNPQQYCGLRVTENLFKMDKLKIKV